MINNTVKAEIIGHHARTLELPLLVRYRKNLNNWTVCYEVQNSLLWKGTKTQQKHGPFPPSETEKKQKFLDHTRRGKSNDIAHLPIIQIFTVCYLKRWLREDLLGVFPPPESKGEIPDFLAPCPIISVFKVQ